MKKINHKEFLVAYCREKHKILRELTPLAEKYFIPKDYKEIRQLPDSVCHLLYNKLHKNIYNTKNYGMTSSTCVFCLLYHSFCDTCTWGKNHGKCNEKGAYRNVYNFILKKEIEPFSKKVLKQIFSNASENAK